MGTARSDLDDDHGDTPIMTRMPYVDLHGLLTLPCGTPPSSRFYPYMASNMLGFNSRCPHAHKHAHSAQSFLTGRTVSVTMAPCMGFSLHGDGLSIWTIHTPSHPKKKS